MSTVGRMMPKYTGLFAFKDSAVLTLQERIQARIERMMRDNPGRVDLYIRYQQIVAEFNNDKDAVAIQKVFDDLFKLHESLDDEEVRYVREGFSNDKELAIYDLLAKDNTQITKDDLDKIKKIACTLMRTVEDRQMQMNDLRDRASTQAQIKIAIVDELIDGMPEDFSSDDLKLKAEIVFEYIQSQVQQRVLQ